MARSSHRLGDRFWGANPVSFALSASSAVAGALVGTFGVAFGRLRDALSAVPGGPPLGRSIHLPPDSRAYRSDGTLRNPHH